MAWLLKRLVSFGVPDWAAAMVIFLLWCACAVGLVWVVYYSGKLDERADWQAKEALELVQAQSTIDRLTIQNQALGKLSLGMATAAKTHYDQELTHEKTNFNRTIAELRAGTRRLSIPTKAVPACAGGISLAVTDRPEIITETRAELSGEASEDILTIGHEVDTVVIECNNVKQHLTACYAFEDALQQIMQPPTTDISQGN